VNFVLKCPCLHFAHAKCEIIVCWWWAPSAFPLFEGLPFARFSRWSLLDLSSYSSVREGIQWNEFCVKRYVTMMTKWGTRYIHVYVVEETWLVLLWVAAPMRCTMS
jgi:hypothetical protein